MSALGVSHTYQIDGMTTHVLEAGRGRPVILLHGGEWGGCAALTWELLIPVLAQQYRVIAPDWLGFGGTAKVVDVQDPVRCRLSHMQRLLETLQALDAAYVGNSMGGALLLAGVTAQPPAFPAQALILAGAGGFVPDNAARRVGNDYDGTFEGMRTFLRLLLHDSELTENDDYVRRWHDASLVPGAYEVMASARLTRPGVEPASPFGRPDRTPYERVKVPTLVAGGAEDTMRLQGWMEEFVPRLPAGRSLTYPSCGHLVPIDAGGAFADDALAFLLEVYPPQDSTDEIGQ